MADLVANGNLDLRITLQNFKWGITDAILTEIQRRSLGTFFPARDAFQIPLSSDELSRAQAKHPEITELDLADQTLVEAAMREYATILTDDGGLFLQCEVIGIPAFKLPHFCLSLAQNGYLSKTEMYQALRYWKTIHRYSAKSLRDWHRTLEGIA